MLWGLLAIWAVFTWNLPVPALDLAGMASAVLLWPFWATWLLSGVLARTGWTIGTEVWFFPEVLGALAGLGGGLLLLIRSRR